MEFWNCKIIIIVFNTLIYNIKYKQIPVSKNLTLEFEKIEIKNKSKLFN